MSRSVIKPKAHAPTLSRPDAPPGAHVTPDTRHLTLSRAHLTLDTRHLALLLLVLLTLLTLLAYWPIFQNDFVRLDDERYITQNPHVVTGLNWDNIKWAFTSFYAANWHPLTWLSHMADCQLFGLRPAWHHGMNLVLHTANSLLLFYLLVRSASERREPGAQDGRQRTEDGGQGSVVSGQWSVVSGQWSALWPSFLVAALFALHPLHVESVAWVAERKDVLSTFFFLLTLIAYSKYVAGVEERESGFRVQGSGPGRPSSSAKATGDKQSKVQSPKPSVVSGQWSVVSGPSTFRVFRGSLFCYLSALFLFALGLMAKPMLVTLPFVLLLLDIWPFKRVQSPKSKVQSRRMESPKSKVQNPKSSEVSGQWSVVSSQSAVVRGLFLEKLPFFALSAASCIVTFFAQKQGESVSSLQNLPLWPRIETALVACLKYLGSLFWPRNLAVLYPHPALLGPSGAYPAWLVTVAVLVLTAITAVALWSLFRVQGSGFRVSAEGRGTRVEGQNAPTLALSDSPILPRSAAPRTRHLTPDTWHFFPTGWFWFLGTLMPVIGLVQVGAQERADRYTYIPSIGIFIIVAWLFTASNAKTQRCKDAKSGDDKTQPTNLCAFASLRLCVKFFLAAGVLLACALLTHHQCLFWKENFTLLKHAIDVTKNNAVALYEPGAAPDSQLTQLLSQQRNLDDAIAELKSKVQSPKSKVTNTTSEAGPSPSTLDPRPSTPGVTLTNLTLDTRHVTLYYQLASACILRGSFSEAITNYHNALELDPGFLPALNDLAWLLATAPAPEFRDGPEAVRLAERACQVSGGNEARFWGTLDAAYAEAGRWDDAIATAQKTKELALKSGDQNLADLAAQRMSLYRKHQPFRQ